MPYTEQEYRRKKAIEMNKWDTLLNQKKISPLDYLRHLEEFEAEHKEEEAQLREGNRIRAYTQNTLQKESLTVFGKEFVPDGK